MKKKILLFAAVALSINCQSQELVNMHGKPELYLDQQGKAFLKNVDEAFDLYPPTTEFSFQRKQALLLFDAVAHNTFYDKTSHLKDFATMRAGKVLVDLGKPFENGVRLYKIYNDGFIIRTKGLTFAVDLNSRAGTIVSEEVMSQLVNHCAGLFITHNHSDHYDLKVVDMFKSQGKPVYAIDEFRPDDPDIIHCYPPAPGKSRDLDAALGGTSMKVRIFPGHQGDLQDNNYVFYLPEGYTVAHIGDQFLDNDMEWIDHVHEEVDIDVLIMECWINQEPRAIAGYGPKLIVSGHENEMGHTIDHREAFWLTYLKMEEVYKVQTPHVIMGWGEWFTYRK